MFLKKYIPDNDIEYMSVGLGFLRLFLILMLLAGWIAAASASTKKTEFNTSNLRPVKLAYLISVFLAFIVSSAIFLINFFKALQKHMPNLDCLKKLSLVTDMVFFVAVLASSIACAVAESKTRSLNNDLNKGAFAIAAFFGFLSCIAYLIQIAVVIYKKLMQIWKKFQEYLKERTNLTKKSTK